ncbi:alpha/beta hydrolase [Comamonas sp. BIGb0124]|uniref:alpha/beta hydrolase n=1 Tax=Comamonas sp. BIGb0124 TaxID=2485130 RepID=UPI00131549EA|nr:alpha/beta hydrolase-fold protein [Comamonas sp. BIGb0124]
MLTAAALGPATAALAQRAPQAPAAYGLFESEPASHRLARQEVQIGEQPQHQYQLFTAVPRRAAPAGGFPVLYMLDGNSLFDRLTAENLALAADLVIVGVGYPSISGFDIEGRTRDYTPPLPKGSTEPRRDKAGGAPQFQRLLAGPLRAVAEQDMLRGVALDSTRRSLWGHSYGGLFALYTLLTQPRDFSRYLAISPSSTWGDSLLAGLADRQLPAPGRLTRPQRPPAADVLVMLGDSEARGQGRAGSSGAQPAPSRPPGPNPATLQLVELLRRQPSWKVQLQVLEGLGHGATFMASLPRSFALAQA